VTQPIRQTLTLSHGEELSFLTAGTARQPAVLLLHGFPSSAHTFRDIMPALAADAWLIAPDLPGFGASDVLPTTSFAALAAAVKELLEHLAVGPRYIYLHDFGAPVGLELAMRAPDKVLGLIIQNANAHESGFGPQWAATRAFWDDPTPENAEAATAHLTLAGTRDQYIAGVPQDVAARIDPAVWAEDWRVMRLTGRLAAQRDLIADYGRYVGRFGAIADYLKEWQPPALMVWGRHDSFFALDETLSWMRALPRMETHILDGGHFLLETHAEPAAALIGDFIRGAGTGRAQGPA
jgi:pimeloyl-ACP methyl ester carboxylesterase